MAKATITPSKPGFNGDVIIDNEALSTDGAEVTYGKSSNMAFLIENTDAADLTVTIAKGVFSNAPSTDLTITVAGTSQHWIGPIETAAYGDASGKIQFDFESTGTVAGTIAAIELP